jgi:hypothetical protein
MTIEKQETTHRPGLQVQGGLHNGAVVDLAGAPSHLLGSAGDADIMLVDDGIADHQCRLAWNADKAALEVTALATGLTVYERELAVDGTLDAFIGSRLDLGEIALWIVWLAAGPNEDGLLEALPLSEPERRRARGHVLRQTGVRAYARDVFMHARWPRYAMLVVGMASLVAWTANFVMSRSATAYQQREDAIGDIERTFPAVQARLDHALGITTYEGYVNDQRELNQLRSIALAFDEGRVVIRVVPMDVLAFNASAWLESYYERADVEAVAPGALRVTLSSPQSVRDLAGWDFDAIAARLKQELPSLKKVNITIADPKLAMVSLPAANLGFSVMPLDDGRGFVIGADGSRLFVGAQVKEGELAEVSRCGVALYSIDTGTTFDLKSGKTEPCNQYVPPRH